MKMRGNCFCEAVKFDVEPNPDGQALYQCHCSQCRKVTGSACNTAFFVDLNGFDWVSGEENIRVYRKPTGYTVAFCNVCGSTVPNLFRETRWWIPAGLLNDDAGLVVSQHQWVESKSVWDEIGGSAVLHERLPLDVP